MINGALYALFKGFFVRPLVPSPVSLCVRACPTEGCLASRTYKLVRAELKNELLQKFIS